MCNGTSLDRSGLFVFRKVCNKTEYSHSAQQDFLLSPRDTMDTTSTKHCSTSEIMVPSNQQSQPKTTTTNARSETYLKFLSTTGGDGKLQQEQQENQAGHEYNGRRILLVVICWLVIYWLMDGCCTALLFILNIPENHHRPTKRPTRPIRTTCFCQLPDEFSVYSST